MLYLKSSRLRANCLRLCVLTIVAVCCLAAFSCAASTTPSNVDNASLRPLDFLPAGEAGTKLEYTTRQIHIDTTGQKFDSTRTGIYLTISRARFSKESISLVGYTVLNGLYTSYFAADDVSMWFGDSTGLKKSQVFIAKPFVAGAMFSSLRDGPSTADTKIISVNEPLTIAGSSYNTILTVLTSEDSFAGRSNSIRDSVWLAKDVGIVRESTVEEVHYPSKKVDSWSTLMELQSYTKK